MNRYLRLLAIVTLCGAIVLTGGACRKKGGMPQMPPTMVKMAQVVKMDTPVIINAFGNTAEQKSVDIVPQVSGALMKTFIKDGDTVTNGQPLFLIDPSDYEARVKQAEGMLKADRANVDLLRLTVDRNKPMFEKKLISQEDFDTLSAKQQAAEAQMQVDEAMLEQAKLSLMRCTITSPLTGICSKRYLDDGNLVAAGMTKLTNIRTYDPMQVEFSVSEDYLPAVRKAMAEGTIRIEIMPQDETNRYSGTLTFMDNAVNQQTGTILLRGLVPNPDLKLWSRQFVTVNIFAGTVPGALMVPEGAVQFGKMGTYLFAVKDGKADMRIVKTSIRYNDLIQILDAPTPNATVAPDEQVVVLGQLMLAPGMSVMEPPAAAPQGAAAAHGNVEAGK
jgi:membrane fusion protein, multidrug efflux system